MKKNRDRITTAANRESMWPANQRANHCFSDSILIVNLSAINDLSAYLSICQPINLSIYLSIYHLNKLGLGFEIGTLLQCIKQCYHIAYSSASVYLAMLPIL